MASMVHPMQMKMINITLQRLLRSWRLGLPLCMTWRICHHRNYRLRRTLVALAFPKQAATRWTRDIPRLRCQNFHHLQVDNVSTVKKVFHFLTKQCHLGRYPETTHELRLSYRNNLPNDSQCEKVHMIPSPLPYPLIHQNASDLHLTTSQRASLA